MTIREYIEKHYKVSAILLVGCIVGIGATVLVASYNGVPRCSLLNACEGKDDLLSEMKRLESEITDSQRKIAESNAEAIKSTETLSKYKISYDSLLQDINAITGNIKKIRESELSQHEKIKQETKFIRSAIDRINKFNGSP